MHAQRLVTAAMATWPNWSSIEPQIVRRLMGGLTNDSYIIQAGEQQWVLRLNAKNSASLGIARDVEQAVLGLASEAELCPNCIYVDNRLGFLVSEYISVSQELPSTQDIASLVRKIHKLAGLPTSLKSSTLNFEHRAARYWQSLSHEHQCDQRLKSLRETMKPIFSKAQYQCDAPVLCHNDLIPDNLLLSTKGRLLAIDWEYAAIGDAYFDLAVIVEEHRWTDATKKDFLTNYHQRPIDDDALYRLRCLQVIYRYLDLLWYSVQQKHSSSMTFSWNQKTTHLHKLIAEQQQ